MEVCIGEEALGYRMRHETCRTVEFECYTIKKRMLEQRIYDGLSELVLVHTNKLQLRTLAELLYPVDIDYKLPNSTPNVSNLPSPASSTSTATPTEATAAAGTKVTPLCPRRSH